MIHKILKNFEIQTDHLNGRRPDTELIKKKKSYENLRSREFYRSGEPRSEDKRNWKDYQRTKKAVEYEVEGNTNCTIELTSQKVRVWPKVML